MATLTFDGVNDRVAVNPITTSINNLPAGAGTMAALCRVANNTNDYGLCGINENDPPGGESYHGMMFGGGDADFWLDDEGLTGPTWDGVITRTAGAGGGNFFIVCWSWAAGTVTERLHVSSVMSAAESWQHQTSTINGGNRAGPGTGTGWFLIGDFRADPYLGDIALIGIWQGTNFSDSDAEALWVNKKTSDWCSHPAGTPDTLIELTSTSLVDIGSDPIAGFTVSGAAATGADPTGWTFDGCTPPVPPTAAVAWMGA